MLSRKLYAGGNMPLLPGFADHQSSLLNELNAYKVADGTTTPELRTKLEESLAILEKDVAEMQKGHKEVPPQVEALIKEAQQTLGKPSPAEQAKTPSKPGHGTHN